MSESDNSSFAPGEFQLIDGPMLRAFPTAVIENLQPLVDGGRYMVKRVVGDDLAVEADVFKDGHDIVAAALKWRRLGETAREQGHLVEFSVCESCSVGRSCRGDSIDPPHLPGL